MSQDEQEDDYTLTQKSLKLYLFSSRDGTVPVGLADECREVFSRLSVARFPRMR